MQPIISTDCKSTKNSQQGCSKNVFLKNVDRDKVGSVGKIYRGGGSARTLIRDKRRSRFK